MCEKRAHQSCVLLTLKEYGQADARYLPMASVRSSKLPTVQCDFIDPASLCVKKTQRQFA